MIRFLVNPAAGRERGRAAIAAVRALAKRLDAPVEESRDGPDATRIAADAVRAGADRLVAIGGDGTLHHAAQALAGSGCALGVVPVGCGNDLAADLGSARDLREALRRAVEAEPRPLDAGRAGGRIFLTVAGIGFDGEVVKFANERARFLRGPLVYPYSLVRTLFRFVPPLVRVEHDAGAFEGRVTLVAVANTTRFGGGMRVAPGARPDDGMLEIVVVREMPRGRLLRLAPLVYRGRHVRRPEVSVLRSRRVTVSADRPLLLQADGELIGTVGAEPVPIEALPGAMRMAT